MNQLWPIYHLVIPDFLEEFAATAPMQRLKQVGMNCGCEYTQFPRFANIGPYSRFDHSLGVALIIWHFTGSIRQTLAGLFHDVTTPVFAHVVDFLNGDHLRQESTEAGVAECLAASPQVMELLTKYGIDLDQVADYHRYPIADNDAPALAADRLEYTLGNLLNYGFANLEEIKAMYQDLTAGEDEAGRPELVFQTLETAVAFARDALWNSCIYVADEDRFAMQALADILRLALQRNILCPQDLRTTEPEVIEKLEADSGCKEMWRRFCTYSRILREKDRPASGYWVSIDAKKRWIDPLHIDLGRVSTWDMKLAEEMKNFRKLDFSYWLSAE